MSKAAAIPPGAPKGGLKPVPNGFTPERHQTSALRSAGLGKVAERVVHDIRAYIEANDLQPGQRLPPERYFIEQLKVSRSSLREAMRVLADRLNHTTSELTAVRSRLDQPQSMSTH